MKKKMLGIFLVLSMAAISAEKNIETKIQNENNLIKKVEKNELAIDMIKKQYSVDLKEIENKYKEKENILKEKLIDIKNEKEEIKLEKNEILKEFNILDLLLKSLGIFSLVGIIIGIIAVINYCCLLWKKIDKKIQEEADKEIKKQVGEKTAEIVNCETEKITGIVKKHDIEQKIKQNKKICILSIDSTRVKNIKKILKEFNQTNLNYELFLDIKKPNFSIKDYDLVLINHEVSYGSKELNHIADMKKINKFITDNNENYFFYYGSGRVNSSNMKKNYCNSIFTLYGNLIDLLRTQDLLEK